MKKIMFAIASCIAFLSMTSCDNSTLASGEELETLNVVAEKPVVDVEEFKDVDVTTSDNLVFKTSDGNVIKGNVMGLRAKGVSFSYGKETATSRIVNVRFVAETGDGEQRSATTSYEQRKAVKTPEVPVQVVNVRLEPDTTMIYSGDCVQMILNVKRIYTYSDKHEESVPVVSNAVFTVLDMPNNEIGTRFISNGDKVEDVVFWKGLSRQLVSEKTYDESQCQVTEKVETLFYKVSATSDANEKCDIPSKSNFTTRSVVFKDAEAEGSLVYTFNFTSEFVGSKVEDRGLTTFSNANGTFSYDGTYVITFNHQLNGVTYTQRTLKTDIYSK